MSNNTPRVGRSVHYKRSDMDYYDQLPPTARAALANAKFNWSAGATFNRWKRGVSGYKTGLAIAATIKQWDATAIARSRKNA